MTEAIRGFWVASATPLATDGGVDHARLAAHAKQLFSKGVDGVVLFGTTGARVPHSTSPNAWRPSKPCSRPASRRRASESAAASPPSATVSR
ncbi:dihydrodipicolinate synthase family protein [Bradyrhizobium diazoefficiens]